MVKNPIRSLIVSAVLACSWMTAHANPNISSASIIATLTGEASSYCGSYGGCLIPFWESHFIQWHGYTSYLYDEYGLCTTGDPGYCDWVAIEHYESLMIQLHIESVLISLSH